MLDAGCSHVSQTISLKSFESELTGWGLLTSSASDSLKPLAVVLGLASLHAVGLALARLDRKSPGAPRKRSWLPDDILYDIFSYLDPADAAQAGLVCTQWHRNATHASYREVTLHTSSPFSRSLARTLLNNPALRSHVRHLTVVHCAPYPQEHLYEWIYLLPPFSLKTCRIFGVPEATTTMRNAVAVNTTYRTEIASFGYRYSKEVLLSNIAGADDPAWRQLLINMLAEGWQVAYMKPYRAHMEAVSGELTYPDAVERFSECIGLIMHDPAIFQADITVMDARGVTRERVDALVEAAGKYVTATTCISVTLTYQFPCVGGARGDGSSGSGKMPRFARLETVEGDVQQLEPSRCLCTSPPADPALPLTAVIRGGVGFTTEYLTDAAVKRVVDWVWRDAMPDGRPLNGVNLHIAHYGQMTFAEPCPVCELSMMRLYYLPHDAPSLIHL